MNYINSRFEVLKPFDLLYGLEIFSEFLYWINFLSRIFLIYFALLFPLLSTSCANFSDEESFVSKEDYQKAIEGSQIPSSNQIGSRSQDDEIKILSNKNLAEELGTSEDPKMQVKTKFDQGSNFPTPSKKADSPIQQEIWEETVRNEFKKDQYIGSEPYQELYLKNTKIGQGVERQINQNEFLPPKEVLPNNTKPRLYYINPMNSEIKNPPNKNTPYPPTLGGFNPQPSNQYYNPYSAISQTPNAPATNFLNSTEVQDPVIQLPRWQDTDYYYADKLYY